MCRVDGNFRALDGFRPHRPTRDIRRWRPASEPHDSAAHDMTRPQELPMRGKAVEAAQDKCRAPIGHLRIVER